MHISPRPTDLQSPLATSASLAEFPPWSLEVNSSNLTAPRPTVVRVTRDAEIVAQDEHAEYCYLVVSGCARTVRLMRDGRRQIGEFLFPGDVFGWDALDKHDFGAEAVTHIMLHRYSRRGLAAYADRDSSVSRWIRELNARQARAGRSHMVLLGRMSASERIASFFLETAERMGLDERSPIELPMTRTDIADYLGLTIETVCRRLARLRLDETISIEGSKIVIHDRRTLEAAGCEGTMH